MENDTPEFILQKLADIENILRMRLQQAAKNGDGEKDDRELTNQLLVKVNKSLEDTKKLIEKNAEPKEKEDTVQRVKMELEKPNDMAAAFFSMLKGDQGDCGEDCDPDEVAEKLKNDPTFIQKFKDMAGKNGDTPVKGKDYFTNAEIDAIVGDIIKITGLDTQNKVRAAVRDAFSWDEIVEKVFDLILKKKIPMDSIEGLTQYIDNAITGIHETVSTFYRRRSGGGGIDNRVFNGNIEMQIINGTTDISTGAKGMTSVPQDGVINEYDLFSYDDAGALLASSVSITVLKNGASILTCALASATDKHINGLSIRVQKDDIIRFVVESQSGCKNVYLSIKYSK